MIVYGCLPVNTFSTGVAATQPPLVDTQGASRTVGGTIPDGTDIYMAVAAIDSNGLETTLSAVCKVSTPVGQSGTNVVQTPEIDWFDGTAGFRLYA